MGDGLKTIASTDLRPVHDVVKDEVAFVERIMRASKLDWAASVSFYKLLQLGRTCLLCFDFCFGRIHGVIGRSGRDYTHVYLLIAQTLSPSVEVVPSDALASPHVQPVISGISSP